MSSIPIMTARYLQCQCHSLARCSIIVAGRPARQVRNCTRRGLGLVSRDQAAVATLFKRLRLAGVQIVTPAEGEISELHVGLKGMMNTLFLKDLAAKTHRGLRGRVEKRKGWRWALPRIRRGETYR